MKHTFFGGVFPPVHKENSRRKPVSEMECQPDYIVLPLEMSREGQAVALVKPGDKVELYRHKDNAEDGALVYYIEGRVNGKASFIEKLVF